MTESLTFFKSYLNREAWKRGTPFKNSYFVIDIISHSTTHTCTTELYSIDEKPELIFERHPVSYRKWLSVCQPLGLCMLDCFSRQVFTVWPRATLNLGSSCFTVSHLCRDYRYTAPLSAESLFNLACPDTVVSAFYRAGSRLTQRGDLITHVKSKGAHQSARSQRVFAPPGLCFTKCRL